MTGSVTEAVRTHAPARMVTGATGIAASVKTASAGRCRRSRGPEAEELGEGDEIIALRCRRDAALARLVVLVEGEQVTDQREQLDQDVAEARDVEAGPVREDGPHEVLPPEAKAVEVLVRVVRCLSQLRHGPLQTRKPRPEGLSDRGLERLDAPCAGYSANLSRIRNVHIAI
jgi:hypothetical protein